MIQAQVYVNPKSRNPTLDEVFAACKGCYETPARTVSVWIKCLGVGQRVELRIRGIEHESGSVGHLMLTGYLTRPIVDHTEIIAYYNANNGTGGLRLLKSGEK
jgi:hypothetical protein